MTKPQTIDETASHTGPVWYIAESNPNGVSHLYVRRGKDYTTTLCGLSNEAGAVSQTARHCQSCTSRLKTFVDAAMVEHEWVIETVTVKVVRPADKPESDTVRNKITQALARKTTWDVRSVEDAVEPWAEATTPQPSPEVDE